MSGIMAVLAGMGSGEPPVFVSASSAERTTNGTTLIIPAPASIADGDRMYVLLSSDANSSPISAVGSGWSSVGAYDASDQHMIVLSKTAASESGSYTFTFSGGGSPDAKWGGAIVVYRGGLGLTDTVGTFTLTVGPGANTTGASITPTANGTLLFFGARTADSAMSVVATPAGMTQRVVDFDQPARFVYDLSPQAASATGTKTLEWNNNQKTIGALVQIA